MTTSSKQIMTTEQRRQSSSSRINSLSTTGLLLLMIVSVASAFHSGSKSRTRIIISSSYAQQTDRRESRRAIKGFDGTSSSLLSSPTSLPRLRQQRSIQQLSSTRLQFSDLEDNSNTTIEHRWWRKLFNYSSTSPQLLPVPTTTGNNPSDNGSEEQDNVDAYLEFLDRRYRRLHCDDKEEEIQQQHQQQAKNKTKKSTFSAMDWLVNGGNNSNNNDSNEVASTRQQQADALYVLGVAGLASQKLLQKHHLPTTTSSCNTRATSTSSSPTIEKVVELKKEIDDVIEVDEMKNQLDQFVVNKMIIPLLRIVYLVQRQKQLLKRMIQKRVNTLATKVATFVVQSISQGPKSILNTFLIVGGGKQNIVWTIAYGYATIIIFRPVLHAVVSGGSYTFPAL